MPLRLASADTKRIDLGDDSWIEVVSDLSKRDWNRLAGTMPENVDEKRGLTLSQGTQFQLALFDALVKGWSLADDGGSPISVSEDGYLDMSAQEAQRIDAALIEHFVSLTVNEEESKAPRGSRKK